ncbi:hypothetical protein DFJ73DRAFT_624169, partial [Zopfochytrium polystomum]
YWTAGRFDKAEQLAASAAELDTRVLGEEHILTLEHRNLMALIHQNSGKLSLANQVVDDALARSVRLPGPDHDFTLNLLNTSAIVLVKQKRYPEAKLKIQEVLRLFEHPYGDHHESTLVMVQPFLFHVHFRSSTQILKDFGAVFTSVH